MDGIINSQLNYTSGEENPVDFSQKMISVEQENFPIQMPGVGNCINKDDNKIAPIDFVLVYMDNNNQNHVERREKFEESLVEQGLELEYEDNRHLCFIKIRAPKEVLCRYCEIMKLRMPIRPSSNENENDIAEENNDIFDDAKSWFIKLFSFAQLDSSKFPPKKYRLATEFSRDKDYLFDTEDDKFFPTNIRVMIVDFILERQSEGIQRLLAEGVYSAAYPLHDGTYKQPGSTRALLYEEWASAKKWIKLQPLDSIQEYFGVNFAIYFAWLGFYTYMLIPASIVGLLCFLYGLVSVSIPTSDQDECSTWAENIIMCPQCDRTCDYWKLSDSCVLARITRIFDNPAITAFAVFMAFWSVLYLELWKRRTAELTYHWGLVGWDRTAEHPRPQYIAALANSKIIKVKEKMNAVTQQKEPHVSFWKVRVPATLFSFSIVLLLASVAVASVFAVVLYRMSRITTLSLFGKENESSHPSYNETFTLPAIAAALNLVCILVLNYIYDWVAVYLTEMELLRTQAEFDDSLTLKIYLFQFINYYASIFYIAFLKGKFIGYPKKYNRILGYRQEECLPGGCLLELCIQLTIIMVGKQALYTAVEMVWPILMKWWALIRIHTGLKQKDPIAPRSQWIRDFKLLDWSPRGLYDEYLEMVIQFGFITLFVVAFPLAPLFALANNVLEMRLDATKFLRHYRRPVPRRARDIGIWARILDALARISVMTNAFIIAFSSNLIPRLVYTMVVSPDKSDAGFLDHSLAYFNTVDFANGTTPKYSSMKNITSCRYAEYRNPPDHSTLPYKRPTVYWHILAARLAFIVVFQNVVGLVTMSVQWCLSTTPRKLRDRIKREAFLTEELIIKREAERARERLQTQNIYISAGEHMRKRTRSGSQTLNTTV